MSSTSAFTYRVIERCPRCNRELVVRHRRVDDHAFAGCSGYPKCKFSGDLADAPVGDESRGEVSINTIGWLDDRLRRLIFRFHPDKNPDGVDANDIAALLNILRDDVKRGSDSGLS